MYLQLKKKKNDGNKSNRRTLLSRGTATSLFRNDKCLEENSIGAD